ncbi:MAG TPA: hypothetical protein VGI64_06645 [Streptosporangiaceae bacterium]
MVTIVDHGSWQLAAADEALHAPGPEQLWNESYYYDFAAPDGSIGGYVRLGLYPNWDRAWYWACIARRGEPAVLLADNAAPLPRPGVTDVAGSGYAASQQIAEPFTTATLSLRGQAAELPEPAAGYADLSRCAPVSLGLDLTWSTIGGVYPYKDLRRYEIPCRVAGTIRLDGREVSVSGWGERDHSWGERDWWQISWLWTSGRLDDGTCFHGMQANIGFAIDWPSFAVAPGAELAHLKGFSAHTDFGADGLPARSRLCLGGASVDALPLAFGPVAMTSPAGQVSRFPRALCRFSTGDGRTGYGWTEWNQPPGWPDHGWSDLVMPAGQDQAGDL